MPDEAVLVVRGDELDPGPLVEDAERFRARFAGWDRYGISAFYAASDDEVDALCQSRLVRFESVVVFRRQDLLAAGVEVVPTFRTPHVKLCHTVLGELVERLTGCSHVVRANPCHVGGEEVTDGGA